MISGKFASSLLRRRYYISSYGFPAACKRSFCSVSKNPFVSDSDDVVSWKLAGREFVEHACVFKIFYWAAFIWLSQVLVEGNAASRTAILNRPSALNALNIPIVSVFLALLFVFPWKSVWFFYFSWIWF